MERIKNLKINLKKTISVLLTTTVLSTLAGCCTENHEEIIENQNNTIISLEQEKASLEQEKANLQEQLNKLTATPEPETASENLNDNMNNLSSDGAVQLFYENGVLKVDSIGQPYYLKYYKDYNGGPDTGDNAGYVQELIKDGKKYLVDADDFSKVLLSDYESLGAPYYLKYYDEHNGGPDNNNVNGDGFVQEIVKNGKKYLVDANDFSIVLASDYTSINQNGLNTTIVFADGHTEVYANKDFKPNKSYVLTK